MQMGSSFRRMDADQQARDGGQFASYRRFHGHFDDLNHKLAAIAVVEPNISKVHS